MPHTATVQLAANFTGGHHDGVVAIRDLMQTTHQRPVEGLDMPERQLPPRRLRCPLEPTPIPTRTPIAPRTHKRVPLRTSVTDLNSYKLPLTN